MTVARNLRLGTITTTLTLWQVLRSRQNDIITSSPTAARLKHASRATHTIVRQDYEHIQGKGKKHPDIPKRKKKKTNLYSFYIDKICLSKKKRCIPSSTFTLHRPHSRGPNGRQTSYQGKHCSSEPNDRKIEGNTPPWDRKTGRWSWQVLLKLFDVRKKKEKKGSKEIGAEWAIL
jgi:hypothetical protein